jgi:hypothetical protein
VLAKKFALFPPHEDEERKKLPACLELRAGKAKQDYHVLDKRLCEACRVFLMSDRFLGEPFNKLTGIPKNKYPYVVIADTAGCNLNCWYCYAYKLLRKNDYEKLKPKLISPSDLAKCFACKMGYASKYLTETTRHPIFSRVRITGGEPLASSTDTLSGFKGDLYEGTVQFWKEFFIELQREVKALIAEDKIRLVQADQFKPILRQERFDRPTWITLKEGRITIRFDTNGLLFCNQKNANEFLKSIYDLCETAKGGSLYVEIDYSLKGANAEEFRWSQGMPVESPEQGRAKEFAIEDHPQFNGIKNIIEISNDKVAKYPKLKDCLYLTVEKGIDNHVGKCYLYSENSLKWQKFEDEASRKMALEEPFRLSEVKNLIQWTKSYGMKPFLQRYLNRGAKIILKCESQSVECCPEDSGSLDRLIGAKKKYNAQGKDCVLILVPVLSSQKTIGAFKVRNESDRAGSSGM